MTDGFRIGFAGIPRRLRSSGGSGSSSGGNGNPVKPGKGHKCPKGYTYDAKLNLCLADIAPGPPQA